MPARRNIFVNRRARVPEPPRGRRPRARAAAAAVLAAAAALATVIPGAPAGAAEAPPTVAADDERGAPLILGRRERTKWLHLEPARFTLDLLAQYQFDSIEQADSREEATSLTFEETLTAETTGYIVHPNLVELELAGTFGLAQRFFDTGGTTATAPTLTQEQNDFIYAWDFRAIFLRNQTAPLTLYSQRSQQNVSRDFGPTLESTTTTFGAIWDIKFKDTPMRLNAYHRDQDQEGVFGGGTLLSEASEFHLRQDTVEWGGQHRITDHQYVSWQYSYNNVNQDSPDLGDTAFQAHDATATYSAEFGPKFQHTFYSNLSYRNESGDFAEERLRFDNQLRLQHTDRFETNYNYTYTDDTLLGQHQTSHRGTASFRHRLFDSLITSGLAGAQFQEADEGGSTTDYFGNISWNYTKKVPYGIVGADLSLSYNFQENTARTSELLIADEPHTFVDPIGIILNRRSIDPESIRITGPGGLVLFRPDVDYLVVPFSDRTEIRRIPTGLIPAGSGVLIDYAVEPEPANTVTTTGIGFGARYTFVQGPMTGLTLFARQFIQDQQITSDDEDFFIPNDITETVVGAEYRAGDFTLTADHVWHESTLDPYEATRLSARYATRFRTDTTAALSVAYSMIEYQDPPTNSIDLLTVAGDVSHRFSRNLRGRVSLLWREEDDSVLGHTRGLEETVELRWRHRQTEVFLLFRNADYATDTQDRTFQFLQFGIRREF